MVLLSDLYGKTTEKMLIQEKMGNTRKREEVTREIIKIDNKNLLIVLPTSFGKSKIAIDVCNNRNVKKILVVVPKNVLKGTWKEELSKWCKTNIEADYTTYVSLKKYTTKEYDAVIYDECHHITPKCRLTIPAIQSSNNILLSATISKDMQTILNKTFNDLYTYRVTMKTAIEMSVLPEPKVYLIPLKLNNILHSECLEINPKAKEYGGEFDYKHIWKARKDKKRRYIIKCTALKYYNEISGLIEWYKNKYIGTRNEAIKNIWLRKCDERLKWLSEKKLHYILHVLKVLKNQRTLTFCKSIEHTELLGKYPINSKNTEKSTENLTRFNEGKIKHITSVNMLNEGVNLVDCRIGIYACLNNSDTMIIQKMGRILRHRKPILIIPYFKNTREEELVEKMLENYNPELVSTTTIEEMEI